MIATELRRVGQEVDRALDPRLRGVVARSAATGRLPDGLAALDTADAWVRCSAYRVMIEAYPPQRRLTLVIAIYGMARVDHLHHHPGRGQWL